MQKKHILTILFSVCLIILVTGFFQKLQVFVIKANDPQTAVTVKNNSSASSNTDISKSEATEAAKNIAVEMAKQQQKKKKELVVETHGEMLKIKTFTTPKGITVWLSEDHTLPIISLDFTFKQAGAAYDKPHKQGLAQLASNTMDEGAGDLDSTAFQRELQNKSITLRFSSSRDTFGGSLTTLSRHQDRAFELLRLALNEPRFDEEAVSRMANANIARIRSSLSDPSWKAARIMNDKAYQGHAYSMNAGGTISSLQSITPDDLKKFVKTRLGQNNLVITAAGDITAAELAKSIDKIFGSLPEKVNRYRLKELDIQNGGEIFVLEENIPQSIIQIQQDGIKRSDPKFFDAYMMNVILGSSGFGSRLMEEAREQRGLTYGIYSSLYDYEFADVFSVSTSTKNETAQEILDVVQTEMTKMSEIGVDEQELEDMKAYMNGSLPLNLTSNDSISRMMMTMRLDNLPVTYLDERSQLINDVTPADVKAIARKILTPGNLTTVIVGQPNLRDNYQTVETLSNVE